MQMYRIYDSKAESYSNPFYEHTDASAIRAFIAAVQMPEQSGMKGHPTDYTLVGIGSIEHDVPLPALKTPVTLIDGTSALNMARVQADEIRTDLALVEEAN